MFDPYVYKDTDVLVNKFRIEDKEQAERIIADVTFAAECAYRRDLAKRGLPETFDAAHLRAIHAAVYGDVFPWAGRYRNISAPESELRCCPPTKIRRFVNSLMVTINRHDCYKGLSIEDTAVKLAGVMANLYWAHPFRSGNGRVIRLFVEELAQNAGFTLDFSTITPEFLKNAVVTAVYKDLTMMTNLMNRALQAGE